jgi:hypothetical protein
MADAASVPTSAAETVGMVTLNGLSRESRVSNARASISSAQAAEGGTAIAV